MQNKEYGLNLTPYAFADHHTENLQIFEVNAWVNLDLYGTLVGGALPRPVFNMASGTTLTTSTKVENETSPIFPARVEIIQGGGFEKPQIIQPEGSRSDTCRFHGARGAARGRYLNAGL